MYRLSKIKNTRCVLDSWTLNLCAPLPHEQNADATINFLYHGRGGTISWTVQNNNGDVVQYRKRWLYGGLSAFEDLRTYGGTMVSDGFMHIVGMDSKRPAYVTLDTIYQTGIPIFTYNP